MPNQPRPTNPARAVCTVCGAVIYRRAPDTSVRPWLHVEPPEDVHEATVDNLHSIREAVDALDRLLAGRPIERR